MSKGAQEPPQKKHLTEEEAKQAFSLAMQEAAKEKIAREVTEQILREHLGPHPRKKERTNYLSSPEFHEEKRRRMLELSADESSGYYQLIHHPSEYPEIAAAWKKNREVILRQIEDRGGEFSVKAYHRYLAGVQRTRSIEKKLIASGLIKPGREPAEEVVVRRAAQETAYKIGRYLEQNEIFLDDEDKAAGKGHAHGRYRRSAKNPLTIKNFDSLVERIHACRENTLGKLARIGSVSSLIEKTWLEVYPSLLEGDDQVVRQIIRMSGREARGRFRDCLCRFLSEEQIIAHLAKNPRYAQIAEIKEEDLRLSEQIAAYLENGAPSDYTHLYPRARRMKRRFILHLGPTNSGKTHDAMQDLMQAKTGTYLGPLRLMAYEQYETMAEAGIDCQMLTGEEQIGDPEAQHVSSTIEMADYHMTYEVAVIDEAQMISEFERGGAWTAAILGICAERVHVCAAPEAAEIVQRLAASCGDTIEIVWHERMVPIEAEKNSFHFPRDVRRGDALVVFSRRSVHEIARALQERGTSCSVIYGALPYDVRHEEVRKFREGETDVVVATDAIGMGMNLPIRRVVFLEEEKFDGEQKRPLLPQEVRQIAGRAGRYGKYDIGFYTTTGDVEELAATYNAASEQIKDAVIGLPREILGFDARISRILSRWAQIPVEEGYIKMSVEREIKLAERLETMSDNKDRIYDFVNFKFDEEEPAVLFLWEECFVRVLDGENLEDVDIEYYADESTMAGLELIYREYDLLYNCVRYVNPVSPRLEEIQQRRREITNKLMKLLEEQGFEGRKCKRCGRSLPMGYRYGVCEQCFDRRRRGGHRSRR